MFDAIAPRYDFLNRLLSLGIDRRWRKKAVARLRVPENGRVLDMACGTADMALEIARQYPRTAEIVGVDISTHMLAIARRKIEAAGEAERIRLLDGSCEAIPASDGVFDGAVIAFGIRNVGDRRKGLHELRRVLKPDASLIVLEFSRPRSPLFQKIFNLYFYRILPRIGALFSRRSAYLYLPQSVAEFPEPTRFAEMLAEAGFGPVLHRELSWGIVSLFEATPVIKISGDGLLG
ncbi:MAG: bifunctional demethylmenaquinone methyltransferase/2-methoxy-6-polyprenyl-1,4-benzoquinol methylase UbiE [Deltaproteobacteria bacterium]|nr:bifunctional demethylmenaquinone methyltransferase/2-methoxy-6-polyprenyl-1,4-benzoquinol methylase UbiE [Deltaproteobacteria bacterium]